MSVLERVQDDVATALNARDRERVHALRLIASELQKAAKEGNGDDLAVLQRERKRRLEAAEAYREGGSEERAAVGDAVAESGASSPSDMGKVMSIVMPRVKGRAEGKRVSELVREALGS